MNIRRGMILVTLIYLVSLGNLSGADKFTIPGRGVVPKEGFVPNEATAVKVAEAVLIPIYGETVIKKKRPFRAVLKDGIWTVEGQLPKAPPGFVVMGGVATVRISKRDARILFVYHGK